MNWNSGFSGCGEGVGSADRNEAGDGAVHEDAREGHLREAGRSGRAPTAAGRPPCHQPTTEPQVAGQVTSLLPRLPSNGRVFVGVNLRNSGDALLMASSLCLFRCDLVECVNIKAVSRSTFQGFTALANISPKYHDLCLLILLFLKIFQLYFVLR